MTTARSLEIAARVEAFVRTTVIPHEGDTRCGAHGPAEDLVRELVVPIGLAPGRRTIRQEVVARIDVVEAVGEDELHWPRLDRR